MIIAHNTIVMDKLINRIVFIWNFSIYKNKMTEMLAKLIITRTKNAQIE